MATAKRKTPGSKAVNRATTGKGDHTRTRRTLRTHPRVTAFAVGAAFAPWILGPAFADPAANQLPTGGQVGAGSVTMSTAGTKMQIDQTSDKAIINWNCFCIGSNAWVNFSQPSASSVVLNRSTQAAEIFGRMSANGQVFVTSGAGVYFGRTAQVDVGGLMATSLTIRDQDFLAGRYIFSKDGSAGEVVNEGKIVALGGYAALAGPQVRNSGIIMAQAGTVALAAGDRVSLDMIGDGLVKVSVDAAALNALALNAGTLQADGGRVFLTARGANALLDTVINNTGVIRATTIAERGGEIVLDGGGAGVVANSGTITAAGTDAGTVGGSIKILGQYVGLFDGTRIDASGDAGGGTVLVGGNFQGKGPEQNAARTFVGSDATIKADAVSNGDGGKVIVWADDTTRFYGHISVRGGAQGGDGGFVEVSGKQHLEMQGLVDASAPAGNVGTLLLDPDTITVSHSTTATWTGATSGTNPFVDTAESNDAETLTDAFVNTQLGTANVKVVAADDITFSAASGVITFTATNRQLAFQSTGGNISFSGGSGTNTSVSLGTGGLFALDANGTNNTISQAGTTNALVLTNTPLWMRADSGIGSAANPFLTQGLTSLAALVTDNGIANGIHITNSVGGDVNITTLTATDIGAGTALTGVQVAVNGGGSIAIANSGGAITVSSAIDNQDTNTAITLSASTNITVNANITATGTGNIDFNIGTGGGGGTFTLQSGTIVSATGTTTVTGGAGTDTVVGPNVANAWSISGTNAGSLTTGASDAINFTAVENLTGGTGADTFTLAGGHITGTIDGGAGTDTLVGRNTTNTWAITTANGGTLTEANGTSAFTGIENLTGSSGQDTFTISGTGSISGTITGGAGADTLIGNDITSAWTISTPDAGTRSDVNGTSTFTGIENLTGGSGADTFTFSGTGNLTGALSGGAGTDTLVGGVNTTNTWTISGTNAGTLTDANGTHAYTGIENLTGGTGADSFNFSNGIIQAGAIDGGGGANTLNWALYLAGRNVTLTGTGPLVGFSGTEASIGGGFQNITVLTGGGGTNTLTGTNATATWTISGTNVGSYLSGNTLTFGTFQNVTGGSGADTFSFTGPGNLTGTLDGGAGSDTLNGSGTTNTWTLNGTNAGTLADAAGTHAFTGIENLTGGTGTDNFVFADNASVGGVINGGAGTNTLNWNAYTSGRSVTLTTTGGTTGFNGTEATSVGSFQNITTLVGAGTGTNTLTGIDATATWVINGTNGGTYDSSARTLGFTAFQNVTGGSGADTFSITGAGNLSGTLDGGAGIDTLTGNDVTNTWTINGTNAGTLFDGTVTTTFANVENLTGGSGTDNFTITTGTISGTIAGGAGTDTLTGNNGTNTWTISGTNAGTLFDTVNTATFTGIENTQGGSGADTFTFAGGTITGTMDGGAGTDTLLGGNGTNTWAIAGTNFGTLTDSVGAHAYTNIENLTGGTGADTFTFPDGITQSGAINGGAGTNTLDWNAYITGRNVTLTSTGPLVGFSGTEGSISGGFQNITNLVGSGTAANTLVGMDATAGWAITGTDTGTYTVGSNNLAFAPFRNLTGGTGADTFTLSSAGHITGTIDGGAGTNTLVGNSGTNTWAISGPVTSTLTDANGSNLFTNIQNLTGGSGTDNFVFSAGQSVAGVIDGAAGANTLDWSAYSTNLSVTLTAIGGTTGFNGTEASIGGGFQNITALVGGGGGGSSALTGTNASATWTISGTNAGTYDSSARTLDFATFQTLTGGTGADTFTLPGGSVGTIDGGGGAGTNTLLGGDSTNTWTISGTNAGTLFDGAIITTFSRIQNLTGGSGTDNFTITTGTISGTIAGGAGTDTLTGKDATNTWTITGTNAGTLSDGANTATFTGIENTQGGSGADTFTFAGGTITGTMDGGAGTDTLVGNNTTNTWSITGTNAGTLTDSAGAHAFTNIENLTGGTGADMFSFTVAGNLSGTLDGGAGTDTLIGGDNPNIWTINGANSGTLSGGAATATFTGIENLTGGSSTDNFTITGAGTISGTIAGGAGTDTLTGKTATNAWTITGTNAGTLFDTVNTATFTGIENTQGGSGADTFTFAGGTITGTMNGGAGTDTLVGGNSSNTWSITGTNSGTLTDSVGAHAYAGIENLTGGTGADTFVFANGITQSGLIDGGNGVNTIDWSAYNFGTVRNIGMLAPGSITGFQGFEIDNGGGAQTDFQNITAVVGSTSMETQFYGTSLTANWTINALNSGSYTAGGRTIDFSQINYLRGGIGDDTYTLTGAGRISGGAVYGPGIQDFGGTDTLVGNNGANTWTINGANAGVLSDGVGTNGFTGIENLTGGTGADNFVFANNGANVSGVINGGAGANTLDWSPTSIGRTVTLTAVGGTTGFDGTEASVAGGFQNITALVGAATGGNTLTGIDATATWTIAGTDIGTYTSTKTLDFSNFQNLVGGTGADTFVFSDFATMSGTIDGGAGPGLNTLDWSAYTNSQFVGLTATSAVGFSGSESSIAGGSPGGFQNITAIIGGSGTAGLIFGIDATASWTITGTNAGTYTSGNAIAFTNFGGLVGNSQADTYTVSGGGALTLGIDGQGGTNTLVGNNLATTWTINTSDPSFLTDGNNPGLVFQLFRIQNLTGGSAADTFIFSDTAVVSGVIDGGAGTNTLDWSAFTTPRNVVLTGFGGATGFNGTQPSITGGFQNVTDIIGAAIPSTITNVLTGMQATSSWVIDGTNAGSYTSGSNSLNFTNYTGLIGGTQQDTFTLVGAGRLQSIPSQGIQGGIGAPNFLVSSNGSNTWTITGANTGNLSDGASVLPFFGSIQNLTGGTGADAFVFNAGASVAGVINGGAGANTLNWNAYITPRNVVLTGIGGTTGFNGTEASVGGGFQNITVLRGAGSGGNSLTGIDATATWVINGTNAGTYDSSTRTLDFIAFQNVTGGSGADTFSFSGAGNLSGTLDGGAGTDTLIGGNTNNDWSITSANGGTLFDGAIVTTFANIENLTGGSGTDNFTISGAGTISGTIAGGAGTDTLTGNDVTNTWTITGTNAGTLSDGANTATFTGIENAKGGLGADTFTFNGGTLTGTMDGGAGSDTVVGGNGTNTWAITGSDSGTLTDSAGAHAYAGIENLVGGTGADTFVFSDTVVFGGAIDGGGGAGVNTLDWSLYNQQMVVFLTGTGPLVGFSGNEGTIGGGFQNITAVRGGIGGDSAIFGIPTATASWAITGANAGSYTSGNVLAFSDIGILIGGSQADTFTLSLTGSLSAGLNAGAGTNTLVGNDISTTWTIQNLNQGILADGNGGIPFFGNIQHLTGGSGVDLFVFENGAGVSGVVNGGANTNTLDWINYTSGRTVTLTGTGPLVGFSGTEASIGGGFQNITQLTGANSGGNSLTGINATATWTIDNPNAGTYLSTNTLDFANFQNVTGGSGADTFTFSGPGNMSGTINGGAGTDTLVGGNSTNAWAITSADGGTLNGANAFTSIENLTGGTGTDNFTISGAGTISGTIAGGAGTDTLTGKTAANSWTITGTNAGTLFDGVSTATFTGIENTQGGAGADTFAFAGGTITGTMDGGAGTDTVLGGNGANTWAITGLGSGTLTDAAGAHLFSSIENLTGGTGTDSFTLSGTGRITGTMDGGTGTNTLTGNSTANPNVWNITSSNAGNLSDFNGSNNFTNVQNLTGSSVQDVFVFADAAGVTGTINGGAGGNSLIWTNYTTGRTVTLTGTGATTGFNGTEASVAGGFQNVTTLVGAGSGGNSLTGINATAAWAINAPAGGTYTSTNPLAFSGFQNLTGGTGADTFTLSGTGNVSGTINGGTGTDTLVGNNLGTTTTWAITTANGGTLTDANGINGFTGIENLTGGTGTDILTLSGTGHITGTISGGAGTNTLVGNNLANTWTVTGANSGTLTDANGTNAFTGIQNLTGGSAVDTFAFSGAGSLSGTLDGGAGIDTLLGGNNTNTWTINGANAGTLFDGTVTTTFANVESLTGGTGTDNFTITGAGTISGTIAGGAGTDTLTGNSVTNTWTITGTNAGTLSDGISTATFTGIENTQGGAGADTFTFAGGTITGTMNGGAGTDTLVGGNGVNTWVISGTNAGTLTDAAGAHLFSSIENLVGGTGADTFSLSGAGNLSGTVNGGAGTDTLVGGNNTNAWTISGANAGTLFDGAVTTTFASIENLNGGTGADTFTLSAAGNITGTISGGAGADTLVGNNLANAWAITTANGGTLTDANGANAFTGIENLSGGTLADAFTLSGTGNISGTIAGGAGADTLVGNNLASAWAITTANGGTLTDANGANAFTGIENLSGGTLADAFTLSGTGNISGTISGGAGADTLVGKNLANTWAITGPNSGTLTDANGANAFAGIENLTGGTAVDTFTLSGTGNISGAIVGGGGVDTLTSNSIASTWTISGANSGTLTDANGANAFSGIANLTGGTADDTFAFANGVVFGGVINGGAGVNTLNWSAYTTGRTVTLTGIGGTTGFNGTEASVGGGFQNISALVGAGSGANSLTGINAVASWAINATNGGTYTSTNALTFSTFQNVTGGSGADTFTLSGTGNITGTINGGAGTDTLVGNNLASTWTIGAPDSGTLTDANGVNTFTSIESLTGGTAADTFINVDITGALRDLGGTTTLNTNVTTGGSQQYDGPVAIGAAITIKSTGSSIIFNSTVTDPGFDLIVDAAGNLRPGIMTVGAGRVQLFAAGSIIGAGSSVTGTSNQQNVMSSGGNVAGLNVDFAAQVVLLTGTATDWDLTGPPVVGTGPSPVFQIGNGGITVRFNSILVNGAAIAAIQQSGSVIGATLAEIARAALLEAQDTDSVQKQMAYGFSGDVGTTPPMDHRIDETGISVPVCFNDSREGQTCR